MFDKLTSDSDSETEFHGYELKDVKDKSDDLNVVVNYDEFMLQMLENDVSVSSVFSVNTSDLYGDFSLPTLNSPRKINVVQKQKEIK